MGLVDLVNATRALLCVWQVDTGVGQCVCVCVSVSLVYLS